VDFVFRRRGEKCARAARGRGLACLGRLGDDQIGRMVVAGVEAEGVDCSLVRLTPGARSAFSSVYVDAGGERQIVSFRGEGLDDRPT
jgi:sulfofructose kinase